jgi:hypothetical protein
MSARRWIALWAGFLAVLTALMAPFGPGIAPPLLLGGAALGVLALALVAAPGRSPAAEPGGASLPAVVAAVGIALLVAGSEFGPWVLAIGAGLLVLAAGMLVSERRPG